MALENAIDAFFHSIDRVGHDFAENRANMLYAAGMIGLAAAMAMENGATDASAAEASAAVRARRRWVLGMMFPAWIVI